MRNQINGGGDVKRFWQIVVEIMKGDKLRACKRRFKEN